MKFNKKLPQDFQRFDLVITVESEREQALLRQFFGTLSCNEIATFANRSAIENAITDFQQSDKEVKDLQNAYYQVL